MKLFCAVDEWYPVYEVGTVPGCCHFEIEVPDDKAAKWLELFAEFDKMQQEISKLGEEQRGMLKRP